MAHDDTAEKTRTIDPQSGFTLIELLVVLVILGLLAVIVGPPVFRYLGKAKTDTAKVQIQALSSNLDLYRLDTGRYPSQQEGLLALLKPPATLDGWNGPYIKKEASLIDPWGTPYVYRIPGEHGEYDLLSLGADKAVGGSSESQDVGNW